MAMAATAVAVTNASRLQQKNRLSRFFSLDEALTSPIGSASSIAFVTLGLEGTPLACIQSEPTSNFHNRPFKEGATH